MILEKLREWARKANTPLGWGLFVLAVSVGVFQGGLAIVNDIGFAAYVQENRSLVLVLWISLSVVIGLISTIVVAEKQRIDCAKRALSYQRDLENCCRDKEEAIEKISNLESELASALKLGERYEIEAKEDILHRLDLVLIASIQAESWDSLGARIIKVRTEVGSKIEGFTTEYAIEQRARIHINIGGENEVKQGMLLVVRDRSDGCYYGTIRVEEVYDQSATCRLQQLGAMALWSDVALAADQNETRIIDIAENKLVPNYPCRSIDKAAAETLHGLLREIIERG